ncbi:MAG: zinc metallopeptidase [Bacilli bacterium]|nr:zinc metallopeptidase [Bacilli bacterium]
MPVDGLTIAYIVISILILIGLIVALIVQLTLIIRYQKYNKLHLSSGLTSMQTARRLLDANGLQDVEIKKLGIIRRLLLFGNHYSVMKNTIYLRKNILNSSSVTAVGIATQKVCLAIQHKNNDHDFKTRYTLQILSFLSPLFFYCFVIIGLIIDIVTKFSGVPTLIGIIIGFVFYLVIILFQIFNIKVEKKANQQAIDILRNSHIFEEFEIDTLQRLLNLYIVGDIIALIISILKIIQQILKLLILAKKNN